MEQRPARLGELIEKVVASLGQAGKFHGWRMVSLWPEIVGPEIAGVSRAIRFSEGIMTIVVEKDVWRQELEMQRDKILARIRLHSGGKAVKKIVFRAGWPMEKENENRGG